MEQLLKRKNDEQSTLKAQQKEELSAKTTLIETAERKGSSTNIDCEMISQYCFHLFSISNLFIFFSF